MLSTKTRLPRLLLKRSHCGTGPVRGESADDLFEQCGQSWEGRDVWEELAGCEGMRCPHLHKAQEAGQWGRGTQLRLVLCDRKGWKNANISLPSTYALQAREAVHHAVVSEACWQPQCLPRLYSVTLIQTLDKAKTSNTCGTFHSLKMSPL